MSSIVVCEQDAPHSEVAKIALRDVGNKLLLTHNDSSSLIFPIIKIENNKYQLAFQNTLSIEPNTLVSIVRKSFEKASLPSNYRVEVLQCNGMEVAYSYEIKNDEEKSIIPCAGRVLPLDCYIIQARFI